MLRQLQILAEGVSLYRPILCITADLSIWFSALLHIHFQAIHY